jgi:hypothetical protein
LARILVLQNNDFYSVLSPTKDVSFGKANCENLFCGLDSTNNGTTIFPLDETIETTEPSF